VRPTRLVVSSFPRCLASLSLSPGLVRPALSRRGGLRWRWRSDRETLCPAPSSVRCALISEGLRRHVMPGWRDAQSCPGRACACETRA